MVTEIIPQDNDITYQIAKASFPSYEIYKRQAEDIADYIRGVEVSEDTITSAKETLAKARKVTERLDRVRIDMKKEILSNYTVIEAQIKDITRIIDDADKELRGKVGILTEMERQKKKESIKRIWNKRVAAYPEITELVPDAFDQWLSPKHLNKSASMKAVEDDMRDWLYVKAHDLEGAEAMGDEYLAEYLRTGDFSQSVKNVEERRKINERIQNNREEEELEETAVFIVKTSKDIALTELLLKSNNITYERK